MTDLSHTIIPKSDQLNADSLITGPMTILITKVTLTGAPDQPVAIHYEGGEGKPYKPCLSMRRVLVKVWDKNGQAYVGRRLTLYRDDNVRFGKDEVGGIRISHMSDIDREVTMALTTTRGQSRPFKVRPLAPEKGAGRSAPTVEKPKPATNDFPADTSRRPPNEPPPATAPKGTMNDRIAAFQERCGAKVSSLKLKSFWAAAADLRKDLDAADPDAVSMTLAELTKWWDDRLAEVEETERAAT